MNTNASVTVVTGTVQFLSMVNKYMYAHLILKTTCYCWEANKYMIRVYLLNLLVGIKVQNLFSGRQTIFYLSILFLSFDCTQQINEGCLVLGIPTMHQHLPHCTKKGGSMEYRCQCNVGCRDWANFWHWLICMHLSLPTLNQPCTISGHCGGISKYQVQHLFHFLCCVGAGCSASFLLLGNLWPSIEGSLVPGYLLQDQSATYVDSVKSIVYKRHMDAHFIL